MEKKLSVGMIFNEGLQIALKNVASIFGAVILWVLTIWIPYINVGTTIAIMTLPIELSKGNVMSPTAIFDPKYRKYMGEFFILTALMGMAIYFAAIFLIVPAIVIGIAWSMAVYLLLDKGLNPMQAIAKSNQITYGYKWTMFFGKLVLILIPYIVVMIGAAISGVVGAIIMLIGLVFLMPASLAGDAVIYKKLAGDDAENVAPVE
ncbi:MAG: hypothetical protein JXL97_06640 [Bacteroidales bacterium]|nr:hypothetical protein [Bacteroidales bacterium]